MEGLRAGGLDGREGVRTVRVFVGVFPRAEGPALPGREGARAVFCGVRERVGVLETVSTRRPGWERTDILDFPSSRGFGRGRTWGLGCVREGGGFEGRALLDPERFGVWAAVGRSRVCRGLDILR